MQEIPRRTLLQGAGAAALLSRSDAREADEPAPMQEENTTAPNILGAYGQWAAGVLYLLLGAVALLLGIGCANVSILLLAQGSARQNEFAVRAAVGAQAGRIVRQLLTESILMAALGVTLGAAASYAILAGIKAVLPRFAFAPEVVIRINVPVLLFSIAVAAATALLFGLWPALQMSRTAARQIVAVSTRRVAGSVRGRRTHQALIAFQIALTLVLLAGAGSAMKGFLRMIHTPLGYDPHYVMALGIPLRANAYTSWPARAAYFDELRAKAAETPGVLMAAISSNATPPRNGWFSRFEIPGEPAAEQQKASVNLVGPGYFAILREPLVSGRVWDDVESRNGAHVAVINRTLAQRYFPKGDAIGRSLKLPELDEPSSNTLSAPQIASSPLAIIGIVEDARNDGLLNPIAPAVFVPHTLHMWAWTQILVRTATPPLGLAQAVRRHLTTVDPQQQTAGRVEDLESWIVNGQEWQQERLAAWIFGAFGLLALALAGVGLYSVVSYTVAQRTSEFGVRMALGAQRAHVLRIVFGSNLWSMAAGVAIGLGLTLALNPLLASWAKGSSRDPWILAAGALLLGLVSAGASVLPALQACRLDPMAALRSE